MHAMKRKLLLFGLMVATGPFIQAQTVTAVTGLRLYEHHSPTISGSQSANGVQSGYDFVARTYFNSFNQATFGAYTNGEESNIDMVEHNGPYGNGQKFGFTSATSSIWNNEIKGNGLTKWMEAPAALTYAGITAVSNISAAYNAATATQSIAEVKEGKVYLARIRNTALYVAMRAFNVKNKTSGDNDVYFDFEYKYGTLSAAGISNTERNSMLSVYPNPAGEHILLENALSQPVAVKMVSVNGQEIRQFALDGNAIKTIDLKQVTSGVYFLICTAPDGQRYTDKFIRQ